MHINTQIRILVWSYALLAVLHITLFVNLGMLVNIIRTTQGWSEHSTRTLQANAEAFNAFLEAETKGRYASFDPEAKRQMIPLREKAIKETAEVIEMVAGNPYQQENAREELARIKLRFETQDRQIGSAVFVDGRLQSNPVLTVEGIEAQSAAVQTFTQFGAEERRLLLDRFASISGNVWRVVQIFVALGILGISATSFAFWWTWRTLRNARKVAKELRHHQGNGGLRDEQVSELINLIEQAG